MKKHKRGSAVLRSKPKIRSAGCIGGPFFTREGKIVMIRYHVTVLKIKVGNFAAVHDKIHKNTNDGASVSVLKDTTTGAPL
ncbi:hypothetical protein AMS62_24135 [Bacillus sp. FJAT-18019]|nr:hypothetical protein AMS62_24135 [Bacillus sp. FJAT-18019]